MKKFLRIFAAAVALMFCFTGAAHAEWTIAGQIGTATLKIDYERRSSVRKSTGTTGIFGQWRSDHGPWGIHFGSAEAQTRHVGHYVSQPDRSFTLDVIGAFDVLAMRTIGERIDGRINGVAMFGISTLVAEWFDNDPRFRTGTHATTANGWKIAGGLEYPFANNWVVQAVVEYADYGKMDGWFSNATFSQLAHRINIGYRF